MTHLLHTLYAAIWKWSVTPYPWRRALVKPVYKGKQKDRKHPASYRGITLSSAVAKNFESILDNRLATFTYDNDTCTNAQYGGKQDHGTMDALYPLISHIQTRKKEGKVVYCDMIDFETAYPSVSRPQLYKYMEEQGIQGKMLAVVKSLTKSLYVRVLHPNIKDQEYVEIQRGLAEGSALSPRLYAIFLANLLRKLRNEFPNATCTGKTSPQWIGALAYVDDLCLCADSIEELNKMITVAHQWAEDHRAKINYEKGKSEVIVFNETPAQKTARGHTRWEAQARFPYPHEKVLREVDSFKYLGFTLDSKMEMNKHCNKVVQKIKIATAKVRKYTRAFKKQGEMHYQQQVTLTIWKAIVHVHSTTNSILLNNDDQIQRVQKALDESLAECMGLTTGPILHLALNTDCGILPAKLQQAIEQASLHAKLLTVEQTRPAAQIHAKLISSPLIHTDCLTENMRQAHITLNAVHLWGSAPSLPSPRQSRRTSLSPPTPIRLKTLVKSRKKQLTKLACTLQRRILIQMLPLVGQPPSSPTQQYVVATKPDINRLHLQSPAPYLRTTSQIPTQPLMRARCQNIIQIRSNLFDENNPHPPYQGTPCLRCHPSALIDQGPLLIHTHHPVDNIHHITNCCTILQKERDEIGESLEAIMQELGIKPGEWHKLSNENKTSLTLACDLPAEWKIRKKKVIEWRINAMPYCAMFALQLQEALNSL